jgi:uncharacterized membrane protein
MNLLGSTIIPGGVWLWAAISITSILFLILLWVYWRAHKFIIGNKKAFALKLLGVIVLALFLTEPLQSGKRVKSGANMFVVLADNSSSMNIIDSGTDKTRAKTLTDALQTESKGWLGTISEDFQLRQYIFDWRLQRTTDFSELTFDGKGTSLGTILRTIAQRYNKKPLAGILLFSDGIATDITSAAPLDLAGLPPVYPVLTGSANPQKDLSLATISVTQSAFEDAPVAIKADAEASGYAGKTVELKLADANGSVAESLIQHIDSDQQKLTFNFRIKPEKTGILFYNLEIAEKKDSSRPNESSMGNLTVQEDTPEATLLNNKQTLVVDRGSGPYRVLYVSGRPNWEYKFIKRAIGEDKQIDLVALVRVAKREPRFNFLGRAGDANNPLYRGFNNPDKQQTEEYDQPVLERLNTHDQNELSKGFPSTAQELYEYNAVILDDVEAGFFTAEQMDLIRRFVAERGGGFMMLGGKDSFQSGGFDRTAIGQILPVHLDKPSSNSVVGRMSLKLTREGMLLPWARLRDNQINEEQRLSDMPSFKVLNRISSIKAGANVVEILINDWSQQLPALVVQRYGNGRTASLTVGDIWRWGMKESQMHDDMDKFWRQLFRWLVTDVPEKISIQAAQKSDQTNQPVELQVCVRDKDFQLLDNVSVVIEVNDPQKQKIKLTAEPEPEKSGIFKAVYVPRLSGGYMAKAIVTDLKGAELGSSQTGWATELNAAEFRSIRTNQALLKQIASQTGGRLVKADELNDFARSLPMQNAEFMEVWTKPLWDSRAVSLAVFLVIILCFVGEWAFRRWRGMP